jgi:toxin ParE1/3/4
LLISTERSLSGSIGDSKYRLVVENPGQRIGEIIIALDVLEHNPLIGRPVANGKRELVIGRSTQGYLARYRYVPEIEIVFVLAIRSQREAGYAERE